MTSKPIDEKPREFWVLPAYEKIPGDQGHCFETYQGGLIHCIEFAAYAKLQEQVRVMRESLDKIILNDENRDRLNKVDAETLQMIILHCSSIAKSCLADVEGLK